MTVLSRLPLRSLVVAATALAVAATPRGVMEKLILERDAVLQGEMWRLLTGHLVHTGSYHLIWDVLPLLVLGLLFEPVLKGQIWVVLAFSGLVVSLGLMLLQPGLASYCGLSGVLNGLWVAGALMAASHEERRGVPLLAWFYRLAVLGGLAKIALETATGEPIFTDEARLRAMAVPLAHALGCLAGMAVFVFERAGRLRYHRFACRTWSPGL